MADMENAMKLGQKEQTHEMASSGQDEKVNMEEYQTRGKSTINGVTRVSKRNSGTPIVNNHQATSNEA